MKHVVKFSKQIAEEILNGKRVVEIRFSKSKIPPFGVVSSGDLVYIRTSSEEVIGQFRVKKVIFLDKADLSDLKSLINLNNIEKEKISKFATLIYIGESIRFLTSPIKIKKKENKAWVVLEN